MAETGRSSDLRELGAELASARRAAGLGVRELARRAEISSHSRISEMEAGKRLLTADELVRVFDILGLDDAKRRELAAVARAAEGPGQLLTGLPGVNATLAQLIDYERGAVRIIDAAPLLIPGLLQTSDYARAIMAGQPDSELRVTLRAGRRDILTRSRNPVELIALIGSEALVGPVAPAAVMVDQLRHILDLAARDNITVQVVSSTVPGYHPMLAGAFELLEFPKAPPVVLLDAHSSSTFLWGEDEVAAYVEAAEQIRTKVAMTSARSAEVIAKIVNGMETT